MEGGRAGCEPSSVDDVRQLAARNLRFIEACREGSWLMLEPILSRSFSYLDGSTGEIWDMDRYIEDLEANPIPGLAIDQVTIHVDGDTAIVSARTNVGSAPRNRYLDTYARRRGEWLCVHACVWPLNVVL